MLIFVFISAILLFAFSLRTFEYFSVEKGFIYGSYTGQGNDQDKLKDLINSIWITIVTMTTVGYGDFFPTENYGRIICLLSYLAGTLCVSMTVVALAIISEFNDNELKAYSTIKKLNADNNAILKAAEVVNILCLLRMRVLKKNCKLSEKFVYFMKLKTSASALKDDFKVAKNMSLPIDHTITMMYKEINDNYDNLCKVVVGLEKIDDYLNKIYKNQKSILKVMKKIKRRENNLGKYLVNLNNRKVMERFKFKGKKKSRENK
jgi:hypothetical protein